jgi:hypothetical protein
VDQFKQVSANRTDNAFYRLDTASFILYYVLPVFFHNQCSDFELVSPVYFGHNMIWHTPPNQKVNANAATRADPKIDATELKFAGALIYKLQRKKHPNNQSNADSIFTEDTSTSLQLLVLWKCIHRYFFVRALLIKHSDSITWNEDTLKKLHSMYLVLLYKGLLIDFRHILHEYYPIKDTWLLDDATVLMTTLKWKKRTNTLKITISEGTKEDDSMEPLWVSSNM